MEVGLGLRAGDVHLDRHLDLGVQRHDDVVQAQGLQRLLQADLLALQRDPGLGERQATSRRLTEP